MLEDLNARLASTKQQLNNAVKEQVILVCVLLIVSHCCIVGCTEL